MGQQYVPPSTWFEFENVLHITRRTMCVVNGVTFDAKCQICLSKMECHLARNFDRTVKAETYTIFFQKQNFIVEGSAFQVLFVATHSSCLPWHDSDLRHQNNTIYNIWYRNVHNIDGGMALPRNRLK